MFLLSLSPKLSLAGMTLVRIFTGFFIFRYGRELFHIDGLVGFLTSEHIPFPVFSSYAAKIIELVGGIFLAIGLFTRWVAPMLIVVMCGVIYTAGHGSIFEGEVPFLFILLFTVFFINGAGEWSVDHFITRAIHRKRKPFTEQSL